MSLAILLAAFGVGAQQKKLLAVLELKNKLPSAQSAQFPEGYYTDQVRQAALGAVAPRGIQIISRENLLVLLQASGKKLEECEGECEVETGKRIGADYVISGEIVLLGSTVKTSLRLHDTSAGALLGAVTASGHTAEELDASLAREVAGLLKPLSASAPEEKAAAGGAPAGHGPVSAQTPTPKPVAIEPSLATGPSTAITGELVQQVLNQLETSYYDPRRIEPQRMLDAALRAFADASKGAVRIEGRALVIGGQSKPVAAPRSIKELGQVLDNAMAFAIPLLAPELPLARGRAAEFVIVQGMLSTLDPRTMLIGPHAYREMMTQTAGQFGGLGAVVGTLAGQPIVERIIPGTPAAAAGLAKGDVIVTIDGIPVAGLDLEAVVRKLRGKEGSTVALNVRRPSQSASLDVTITRAIIQIAAVHVDRLDGGVLRIKLSSINATAAQDVRKALANAEPSAVVLDLRGCPGGLLQQAIELADLFLKDGTILTTVGPPGSKRNERKASPGGPAEALPLAVLVDGSTASGAEALAGSLRFADRAILLGMPTAGRGTVQSIAEIKDGIALKLSIAQDLLPGDRSFAGMGIAPDIELKPDPGSLIEREATEPPLGSSRATLRYAAASDPDTVDAAARWAGRLLVSSRALTQPELVDAALKMAAAQGGELLK